MQTAMFGYRPVRVSGSTVAPAGTSNLREEGTLTYILEGAADDKQDTHIVSQESSILFGTG